MRRSKRIWAALMSVAMSLIMLCSSGCIIIVSEDVLVGLEERTDSAIDALEGLGERKNSGINGLIMNFTTAGLKYQQKGNTILVVGRNDEGRRIDIPDTFNELPVTNIAYGAFSDTDIKSVKIGKNVTYIGSQAFANCGDLKTVTFEERVGWHINGVMIDSSVLADKEKAAELLVQGGLWTRK